MYKIKFSNYFHLINWNVIYWGIKEDLIEAISAVDYANTLIENNPNTHSTLVIDLLILDNITKENVLSLINDNVHPTETDEKSSKKILRYIILDSIKQTEKNTKNILDILEYVYADFNYPSDMKSFIRYMPIEDDYDPMLYTQKENEQRLIEKFNTFLEFEKQQLTLD